MEFIDNVTPSGSQYYQSMTEATPGKYWSGKKFQAASDWATMYYQNAYNTALQNYMNEYNSPLQQMLRYQEAGLSPYLVNDPGNMGSSHAGAAPRGSAPPSSDAQIAGQVNAAVSNLQNVLRTSQQVYDYVKFGRPLQELNVGSQSLQNQNLQTQNDILGYNLDAARSNAIIKDAEAAWSEYWNLGRGDESVPISPRARYMEESTQRISAQVEQLQSLVKVLYPSQKDANEARAALTMYQKEILQGQKDAILNIDTGNDTADSILKMVCFWLLNQNF